MMGVTADPRILFAYSLALGHIVTVATVHGDCFEGVLHAMSPDDHVLVLKTVRTLRHHLDAKSQEPTSHNTLIIDLVNVADILIRNTATLNDPIAKRTRKGFQTDTAISGASGARQRQLERWLPDAPEDPSLDLDDARSLRNWDQFKANEAKFGLSTDYSEEIYTTKLDRSRPDYAQRERDAERIAREIERSQAFASNKHLREERGQALSDDEMDEEDRYGAVIREQPPPAAGSKVAWRPQPPKESHVNDGGVASSSGGSQSLNLTSGRYRSFSKSSGAGGLSGAAGTAAHQPTPDQRQRTTSYMAPSSNTISTTSLTTGKPNLGILGKRVQQGAIPAPTGHGHQKHPQGVTKPDGLIPKAVVVAQAKQYLAKVQKQGSLQVVPENEVLTEEARIKRMLEISAQVANMPNLINRPPQVTQTPRIPIVPKPAVAPAVLPTRLVAPTQPLIHRQAVGRATGRGTVIPGTMEEAKKLLLTQASILPGSGSVKPVTAAPVVAASVNLSGGVVGANQIVPVDKINVALQQEKDRVAQKQELIRLQQKARQDKLADLKNCHALLSSLLVNLPRPKDLDDLLNVDRARERLGKQKQGAQRAQAAEGKRSRSKSPARSPQVGALRPATPSKGGVAGSPGVDAQANARAASPAKKPGSAAASPSVGGMSEKDKKKFSLNLGAAAFVPTRPAASTSETRKVTTGFFAGKELKLAPFSLKTHMAPFTGTAPANAQSNHSVLWTFANDNRSYKHDVHGDGVPMGMVPGPYYFFPAPAPAPTSASITAPATQPPQQQQQQQHRNGPHNNAGFNQGGGATGSGGQPQYMHAGPPGAVPPQAFAQVPPGAVPAYPGAIPGLPPGTTYVPIMPVPVPPPPGSQPGSAPNAQAGPNAGGPPQFFAAPTGFIPAGAGGPNQPMYAMVPQQSPHQHQQFQPQQQHQPQQHQLHQQQQQQHAPQQGQNGAPPSGNAQGPPPGMPPMGMMMAGPPHGPPHIVPGGFAGMPPGMVPVPMHPGGPHPGPPPGSMGMMMPPPGPHGGPPPPHMMQFAMPGMQPHQMQMYPGPGPHMQQQQQQQQQQSPSE